MNLNDLRDLSELQARFESKVDRSNNAESTCHLWTGAVNRQGYGAIKVTLTDGTKKMIGPHRLALALATGELPSSDIQALHSCDNPSCVNPKHLRWGSNRDNVIDRVTRDRSACPTGERNGRAQLTAQEVLAIRSEPDLWGMTAQLARQYSVSESTIRQIRQGKLWTHLA